MELSLAEATRESPIPTNPSESAEETEGDVEGDVEGDGGVSEGIVSATEDEMEGEDRDGETLREDTVTYLSPVQGQNIYIFINLRHLKICITELSLSFKDSRICYVEFPNRFLSLLNPIQMLEKTHLIQNQFPTIAVLKQVPASLSPSLRNPPLQHLQKNQILKKTTKLQTSLKLRQINRKQSYQTLFVKREQRLVRLKKRLLLGRRSRGKMTGLKVLENLLMWR